MAPLVPILGQTVHSVHSSRPEQFSIHYRFDKIDIDHNYMDNAEQIEHIIHYLQHSPRIDSITIYSWASPEGGYQHNEWLSRQRGKAAKRFLLDHSPDSTKLNSGKITLSPLAENWPGLRQLVYERYWRHDRDRLLQIIDDDSVGPETKKWRIQQLNEGYTWKIILRDYMPLLRSAIWVCVWAEVIDPLERPEPIISQARTSPLPLHLSPLPALIYTPSSKTIFALKTNLLYDAVTALNAELEIPIGDNFSLMIEDVFPWWSWGPSDNKYAFQLWEMGVEPRWWFLRTDDRDRLSGHFLGVYALSGRYDFQNNKDICYQGEAWSTGLSYGYAMPLGRSRLNLEFSASIGFLQSDYRHYQPSPDYDKLYRDPYIKGRMSYFGPTKLKISLVLPITVTTKRGGVR